MKFEEEVIECILQYSPEAEISEDLLLGKTVFVRDKNVLYHLLPIPFGGLYNVTPSYFQEKSLEYAAQGIQLVHLWQDCWEHKNEKVRSRIAVFSGVFTRIHARRTFVRRLTKDVMMEFFGNNHLQGFAQARYNYGLFCDNQLVAAASFSQGRKIIRDYKVCRSYELVRYSNLLNHRVAGGLGKLIAKFIKDVKPDDIMSYADLDWASGIGYKALDFEQIEVTPPKSFWVHPNKMIRFYPHKLPHKLASEYDRIKLYCTIEEFMRDKGFVTIYNAGNLKYLLKCFANE